ncbi:MAG: corrinoid protein [Candidatus Marinimicrobia bacterium]|nr:corrinoid protein [Candidatus Neomarinimicrobiota bacterium]
MARQEKLYQAVIDGNRENVKKLVKQSLDQNIGIEPLLYDSMIPAMREMGERFSRSEIFVPQMLISARAMQAGLTILGPILAQSEREAPLKVAIGTVKDDLHDIGKNLVAIMLKGAGYEVIDLGTNCSIEKYDEAVEQGVNIIMCSALLTTTRDYIKKVVEHYNDNNAIKVIVGGAPIDQKFADSVGADGYGKDANEAVKIVEQITATQ